LFPAFVSATNSLTDICFQPYHKPSSYRQYRMRLSTSPGSGFRSCVVPYSNLAIINGGAGSSFGSLRRNGVAGNDSGGIDSADV
jgi:hypothetical protein